MTTLDTTGAPMSEATTGCMAATHRAIITGRVITTELRRMFDTRPGFWLMAASPSGRWSPQRKRPENHSPRVSTQPGAESSGPVWTDSPRNEGHRDAIPGHAVWAVL